MALKEMTYLQELLEPAEDDFSWLGLEGCDTRTLNNVNHFDDIVSSETAKDSLVEMLRFMSNTENLGFTCKHLLNLDLAPYQVVLLKNLWDHPRSLLVATRGGGKSFLVAIYGLLKMIFEPGVRIAYIGSSFRQSRQIWDYMSTVYSNAPMLKDICKTAGKDKYGPKQAIDRFEFLIGNSISLFMPLGCFSSETFITTDSGIKEIGDAKDVKTTWSLGKHRNVTHKYTSEKSPTIIIKGNTGTEIRCSESHKIKIIRDGKEQMAMACSIKAGDFLIKDLSERWFDPSFDCTPEQAYDLGTTISDNKLSSTSLGQDWLDFWGIPALNALNKVLPKTILCSSKESVRACIQGLFDTGGTLSYEYNSLSFCNTSKRLIEQIQFILLHFGILSTIVTRQPRLKTALISYELQIYGKYIKKFYENIGFGLSEKQEKLEEYISKNKRFNDNISCPSIDKDVFYDKIESVEIDENVTEKYDLTIEDVHEYQANGYECHNSGEKIRGYRANIIICDEFASIDYNVYNEVIKAFANVTQNPIESIKRKNRIRQLEALGVFQEDDSSSNQIILTGTSKTEFNHFFKEYDKYKKIIDAQDDKAELAKILNTTEQNLVLNPKDYCVMRIPYNVIPEGFLDEKNIQDSKSSMPADMFNREYGACFTKDSTGFYKRSVIEAATCTTPIKIGPDETVKFFPLITGEPNKSYVMGVDTAKESDNAAIVIIESTATHRKIVYCWTFSGDKFNKLKINDKSVSDEYYRVLARKIKYLMARFPIDIIAMDKLGGGEGVIQALGDESLEESGIDRIFTIPDDKKEKYTDFEDGLHIIKALAPNAEINSKANHGMLGDMQQRKLIFPAYDPVELERQKIVEHAKEDYLTDNYEDCVLEIEELKEELELIRVTPTARFGYDHFDVPFNRVQIAGEMQKRRLRKDRYSALLYASYIASDQDLNALAKQSGYICYGTSNKLQIKPIETDQFKHGQMYHGRGYEKATKRNKYAR